MVTIVQTIQPKRAIRIVGHPILRLERQGEPVESPGIVTVGFTLDQAGSVVDRWRSLTPAQARVAAAALLTAADIAEETR